MVDGTGVDSGDAVPPPQCLHRSKVGRYRQQMDEPALFIRVMFFGTFRNFPTNQTRVSHSCRRSLKVDLARSSRCAYSVKLSTSRPK